MEETHPEVNCSDSVNIASFAMLNFITSHSLSEDFKKTQIRSFQVKP
jgi:hypothetical protein